VVCRGLVTKEHKGLRLVLVAAVLCWVRQLLRPSAARAHPRARGTVKVGGQPGTGQGVGGTPL